MRLVAPVSTSTRLKPADRPTGRPADRLPPAELLDQIIGKPTCGDACVSEWVCLFVRLFAQLLALLVGLP